MTNQLSVSIAISTKDRRNDLYKLLNSIKYIDYPKEKIEIVVVEEGDKPKPIEGTKYIFLPRLNKGFGFTRNVAIENCTHNLIAFVDDDCEVTPAWLKELMDCMDEKTSGVTGGVRVKDCNSIGYCENIVGIPSGGLKKINESQNKPHLTDIIVTCNSLVKKDLILRIGGFEETHYTKFGGEDSILSHKLRNVGFRLIYNPRAVVYHKTKDNFKEIFCWALRMGKSRLLFNQYIGNGGFRFDYLKDSIIVKIFLFLFGFIFFHHHALIYFSLILTLYWLKIVYEHSFYRRYIKSNYIWAVLPIVKFIFDIGIDFGRLFALLFYKRGKIRRSTCHSKV